MIRRTLLSLTLVAVAAFVAPTGAQAAPSRYLVILKDSADSGAVASQHRGRYGARLRHVYRHALRGYAATLPQSRVDDVRRDGRVDYVERDGEVRALGQALPWGVDRVDADTSSTRAGNGTGGVGGAHAFVLDTGIYAHGDLNVVKRVNYAGGTSSDCHGHGTHVAGTLAAKDNASAVVGVAPGARLTSVKVLDCKADGYWSDVIAGINYVTRRAPDTSGPDVANVSFAGPANRTADDAIRRSAASGVFYAIAAGNSGTSACDRSPARTGAGTNNGIATVGATDGSDGEPSWSSYGSCVDIWAPGYRILSTTAGGGTGTNSGTSMASPHVAGGGALYRSRHAVSPSNLEAKLKASAAVPGTKSKDGRSIRRLFVGGSAGF